MGGTVFSVLPMYVLHISNDGYFLSHVFGVENSTSLVSYCSIFFYCVCMSTLKERMKPKHHLRAGPFFLSLAA